MSAYLCLVLALFACVTVTRGMRPHISSASNIEVLSSSRSVIDRVHERSSLNASTRHTCWGGGDPTGWMQYYGGDLISTVRHYCNRVKIRLDSGNGHGIFALERAPNCKHHDWRIYREMHWARTVALAKCEAEAQPDQKRRDPLNGQPVTLDEFIQAHIDEDHPENPPIFWKADVLTEMWSFAKVLVEERIDPKYRPGAVHVPLKAFAEMLESEALPEDEVNRRWNTQFPEVPSKISYAEFLKAHAEDGMPEDQLKSIWDTLEAGDYRELEGAHPLCEVLDEDASGVCGWF